MNDFMTEQDDVSFFEPILAKEGVQLKVSFAASAEWEVKQKPAWTNDQLTAMAPYIGQKFAAMKLTLEINDPSVKCEHADAKPRLTIEHQFNIQRYPYPDKKNGGVAFMGRQNLYQLEEALGFEPIYLKSDGTRIEARISKTGRKVAPQGEGIKRTMNPDFANAYFTADGKPNVSNWVGKSLYANIGVEPATEKFSAKNVIEAFVRPPVI